METGSSTARWSIVGRAENDKTGKSGEFVRSLVGIRKKEGDIIVASGSKPKPERDSGFEANITKLEHELCRHCEESRVSDESVFQQ